MTHESKLQPEDPPGSRLTEWGRGYESGKEAGYRDAIKEVVWYLRVEVEKERDKPSGSQIRKIIARELEKQADAIEAGEHLEGGE